MDEKKRVWFYSRISAIEDTHDSLKSQKETLDIYAQQMISMTILTNIKKI